MIDIELLEKLVVFEEYGTLSATAEHLMITAPSVTRAMKKLEDQLGVKLFDREVNRIYLNKTGKLVAEKAKLVLQAEKDLQKTATNFDKMQQYINIGAVSPGPAIYLDNSQDQYKQELTFCPNLIKDEDIISDLKNYQARLIFTTDEILDDKEIESMFIGTEQLAVKVDKNSPLANKKSVTYKDLSGLSFVVARNIGIWKDIIEENIPNAKFLYQQDLNALDMLTQIQTFPVFRTNLTEYSKYHEPDADRIIIPIEDENNSIELFGTYLVDQRPIIQPFLKDVAQNWPTGF